MAASAFKVFTAAKGKFGTGGINITEECRVVLLQSGTTNLSVGLDVTTLASASAAGLVRFASVGNYSLSGRVLANQSWRVSGTKWYFDATDWSLSQTADMTKILAAMILQTSGTVPLCYASLSTATFDLSTGNKLIIQFNASGIFNLD